MKPPFRPRSRPALHALLVLTAAVYAVLLGGWWKEYGPWWGGYVQVPGKIVARASDTAGGWLVRYQYPTPAGWREDMGSIDRYFDAGGPALNAWLPVVYARRDPTLSRLGASPPREARLLLWESLLGALLALLPMTVSPSGVRPRS